jgi:thiamine-monophosphate kinase
MNDDPDEAFVIKTLLRHRPAALRAEPVRGEVRIDAPGDDAALVDSSTLVTVDTMVQGIHFDERLSPGDVGWKLAAVNASDIGAMGATPDWAVLSLSLPSPLDRSWVESFAEGLGEALTKWTIRLVGGDTTGSPGPITVSMTLAGQSAAPVSRSGAQPGDLIWVTGFLGEAAGGFLHRTTAGLSALRRPQPPVSFGAALAARGLPTAMMDLSDGLARDLGRMCRASGVDAEVDPASLPKGPGLANVAQALAAQVSFGEDYQLLFTTPKPTEPSVHKLAAEQRVQVTCIGRMAHSAGAPVALLRGLSWPEPCFSHFEPAP